MLWNWYQGNPWITRVYWLLVLVTVASIQLRLVTGEHLCLSWDQLVKGQVYRVITSMMQTSSGVDALFHLQTLLVVSSTLEKHRGYLRFGKEFLLSAFLNTIHLLWLNDTNVCVPQSPILLTSLILLFSWSGYDLPPLSLFGMLVIPGHQLLYYHLALVVVLGGNVLLVAAGLVSGAISHYVSKHYFLIEQQESPPAAR
eukprot:TRINITY_DN25650_c0_g1_i1.p1 TRINITY_DN25650_c0_g1~~TRINITY_DN25650_c0_g1_i1.p1  ORF type:complete len:199 (+),score=21.69 TRINITY_DN25650_c0_g1_i1:135-731(+)